MSYSMRIVEPGQLVLGRIYDAGTVEDITSLFADIVRERGKLHGAKIFCDVCDARPGDFSFKEMKAAVDYLRPRIDNFAGMKWANHATGLLNYGISRMAGELVNGLPFEYRVFRDRNLAFNWLGVPPALAAEIEKECLAGA